jgi:hypothetical protein
MAQHSTKGNRPGVDRLNWGIWGGEGVGWYWSNEKVNNILEAFIKNMSRTISFRNFTRWDLV